MGDINNPILIMDDDEIHQISIPGEIQAKKTPLFRCQLIWIRGRPTIKRWVTSPSSREMQVFSQQARTQLRLPVGLCMIPTGPVWIKVWLYKRPPAAHFVNGDRTRPKGKLLEAAEDGSKDYTISMKPDTDNCLKFIKDALTGVAWQDDMQVSRIMVTMCYDSSPPFEGRTRIEFGSMDEVFIGDVPW